MATVGIGSPGHLLGFLMQKDTGARFTLVPYRGAGPSVQDVVAGQIDMTFANTAMALPFVRAGSLKALGVTSLTRIAAAPDIPAAKWICRQSSRLPTAGWRPCTARHRNDQNGT